jgi:hypothetical protein
MSKIVFPKERWETIATADAGFSGNCFSPVNLATYQLQMVPRL